MSETSSLIDEKKNQQINEKEQEKNVDWIGFFKATLVNMIYVIIWAMLGSNLVYFLHLHFAQNQSTFLNYILTGTFLSNKYFFTSLIE